MVTLLTLPLLENLVIERLRLNALDIMRLSGITPGDEGGNGRAWGYPPAQAIQVEDLPAVYHMVRETFETPGTRGEFVSARRYIQRWFIAPFAMGVDDLAAGSEMWVRAAPYFSRVPFYFTAYPRLNTSANIGDLTYCQGIGIDNQTAPLITDDGLVGRPAPGGQVYASIDFYIPIVMKMNIRRS